MRKSIMCVLALPLLLAAAPTTKPDVIEINPKDMVAACRQGYAEYKFGGVAANVALANALIKFPENQRGVVSLICYGYGIGYEDGKEGVS